jgi:hypothetical protein
VTPYRQPILPGMSGSDVLAVKRTFVRLHVPGAGTLVLDKHAGVAWVAVLKNFQRIHHVAVDGIYGPGTHDLVAPHFNARDVLAYKSATIRRPPQPTIPPTATDAAKRLLVFANEGKYHADNPGDMRDLQATAAGHAVWSQGGYFVHIDRRPLDVLVWLIDVKGVKVGTFAICSDHHNDGPHGHAGGLAVDISSIDGVSVAASNATARVKTLRVAEWLHALSGKSAVPPPRQLICGGYGNHRDSQISACSIPGADSFYGYQTMQEHCNHIHCGY